MIPGIGERVAKRLIRFGGAAFESQRRAARRHGFGRPAQSQQGMRVVDMEFCYRAGRGDSPLDPPQRLSWLTHLKQQHPHHVQRVRMRRRRRQDLLINVSRLGETSGAMQALAMLKMGVDLPVRVAHCSHLPKSDRIGNPWRWYRIAAT
jgi:hypothetical protein